MVFLLTILAFPTLELFLIYISTFPKLLYSRKNLSHVPARQWDMFDATPYYESVRYRDNVSHTVSRVQNGTS